MAIGAINHGGKAWLCCLVTTTGSSTGSGAFIGRPQLGQAIAAFEISCPHSGQYINDIFKILPFFARKTF